MTTRTIETTPSTAAGETRATLSLAWPMIGSMLGIVALETVDVLMIGRLGEAALAASALGFNLFIVFVLLGVGVTSAVPALAAQALGAGDIRGVRRTMRQGLWLGAALCAPAVAALLSAEPLLVALGQKPALAAMAQSYLDYMAWTLVPLYAVLVLRQTLAAFEDVRPAMVITLGLVPVNAFFNWLLMFGGLGLVAPMGLPGAGLATLLVECLALAVFAFYVARVPRFRELDLLARFWRPDWPRFRALARIGLPTGATLVAEHMMFLVAALFMGWIGTTELAAYHVAMQVVAVVFMVPLGLSQAATIRVAGAAGARDLDRVRRRGVLVFRLTAGTMCGVGLMLWLFAPETVGLFIDADDPNRAALLAHGASFVVIAAFFQLFDGLQVVGGGVLRGLNDTLWAMWLALAGYVALGISAAWVLAFPLGFGGEGVWIGLALGLATVATAALARFRYLAARPERAFRRLVAEDAGAAPAAP